MDDFDGPAGALRALPARRIIAHVADAAERWSDADYPPRVRATAAIATRLGYTAPVVEFALDRLFSAITRDGLNAAIASELGSAEALDGLAVREGAPPSWARGVDRVTIVSSDTTIGVAIVPALFALCAKCDVVVKDRSDALIASVFASLAEEHPAFASAARAFAWAGGDDPAEARLLENADVVVAFGRDQTLRAIRARCRADARFVAFGHQLSIGRLTRGEASSLDPALARSIVRDVLLYDGEGCLSLHALFVESDGDDLRHVAELLQAAGEELSVEFPAGEQAPERVAAVAAYRSLATFRAAGGRGTLYRGGDVTIVVDPPRDETPPMLPRVLPVIGVENDAAIAAYADVQRLPVQALGVVSRDDLAVALAARIGAVRVAPFGTMQDPPLGGHHGGRARVADFVRWVDGA